jgi:hypothetical protein
LLLHEADRHDHEASLVELADAALVVGLRPRDTTVPVILEANRVIA